MRNLRWVSTRCGILVCFLAVLLSACEEDVTAVLGTDIPFSLYGVLTPEFESQFIRVFPIEGTLQPALPEPLDARFTSTDLQDGTQFVWADSIIQDSNEQVAHVFWAPFRAAYGHTYRIEVERSDGAVSGASVAVPPLATLVVQPPVVLAANQSVLVDGDVPRLMKIQVTYNIIFKRTNTPPENDSRTFVYDGRQEKVGGGWLVPIQLALDFLALRASLRSEGALDTNYGIRLLSMTLELLAVNEAWVPPGGVFDPDVLVEPGTLSNVENGFGFIGAGYGLDVTWIPSDEVLQAAGFTLP